MNGGRRSDAPRPDAGRRRRARDAGATAEPVAITDEHLDLALEVARAMVTLLLRRLADRTTAGGVIARAARDVPSSERHPLPPRRHRVTTPSTLAAVERSHILRVLAETNWTVGGSRGAAARLGLKRTTLQSMMRRLGITRPAPRGGVPP